VLLPVVRRLDNHLPDFRRLLLEQLLADDDLDLHEPKVNDDPLDQGVDQDVVDGLLVAEEPTVDPREILFLKHVKGPSGVNVMITISDDFTYL
jgi:hypothetical protein